MDEEKAKFFDVKNKELTKEGMEHYLKQLKSKHDKKLQEESARDYRRAEKVASRLIQKFRKRVSRGKKQAARWVWNRSVREKAISILIKKGFIVCTGDPRLEISFRRDFLHDSRGFIIMFLSVMLTITSFFFLLISLTITT